MTDSTSPLPTGSPIPGTSTPAADRIRQVVRHELVRRTLTVSAVRELTRSIVRVTLTGDDLLGFSSVGPEDHVKVFFPSVSGPVMRDFTPAQYRAESHELDIDFVLHGVTGPAGSWAAAARPGATLTIGGPRGSRLAPDGYRRFLLLADETSLPALSRWVAAVADRYETHAFIQSTDDAVLDYPGLADGATSDLLHLQRIAPGSDSALAALAPLNPDPDSYVWAAGEATSLVPVRRWLRRDLGLAKTDVKVDGYWRQGVAGLDHHAPLDPDEPED